MKQAFTLIELIFVIVIIGILAVIATSKFINLKQRAEVHNLIKIVMDAAEAVPASAVNMLDLEDKSDINLTDILTINGGKWKISSNNNRYEYNYTNTSGNEVNIASISFSAKNRELNISINCNQMQDDKSKALCTEELNRTEYNQTIFF